MTIRFFRYMTTSSLLVASSLIALPLATSAQDADPPVETRISAIQGSGPVSPMNGNEVSFHGIVSADMRSGAGGLFLMSAPGDKDDNPNTAEGIMLDLSAGDFPEVKVGDAVSVVGKVQEVESETRVMPAQIDVLASTTIEPMDITLPIPADMVWEAGEGMYVRIPQPMYITETYNLARYGKLVLSSGGNLINPTQKMKPGPGALELMDSYDQAMITIDDGNNRQNPSPVPFLANAASKTVRVGDSVRNLTGIIVERDGEYQILPTEDFTVDATNPRLETPAEVGGNVKIASFNMLNYFNGNGSGGDFPTPRGADTFEEYNRQGAKLFAALERMDADVIGMMEIENDGFGEDSTIQDIVSELNSRMDDDDKYAFAEVEGTVGTDAICNGLIYRPAVVEIVGKPVGVTAGIFSSRRPPVVASFRHLESGDSFTVAVNHFKSKGCRGADGLNANQNDGQSCFAYERTQAAETVMEQLKAHVTGIDDEDIIVIGDLNAYTMEDPVRAFIDNGWVDLIDQGMGTENAFTYVFRGTAGVLDHMIATPSLAEKMNDITIWQINAAEPNLFDYNQEFRQEGYFNESPFRSSDHDPVIVGLNLGS